MRDIESYKTIVRILGLLFHPDTRGASYMKDNGKPLFTKREAATYDGVIEAAFAVCDPYEVAMEVWKEEGLVP